MVGHFAAFHSNVNMKSKDQVTPRSFLQFVHDLIVPHMIGDQLTFPMAERMGAGGTHAITLIQKGWVCNIDA